MYRCSKPRVHFYFNKTPKSCQYAKKGKISEARIRNAVQSCINHGFFPTQLLAQLFTQCGVRATAGAFVISQLQKRIMATLFVDA